MSRAGDYDSYDEDFNNQSAFWERSTRTALNSKRGQAALRELREALENLPEKRLIADALCTVDAPSRAPKSTPGLSMDWQVRDFNEKVEQQGEGVCAVGALLWWQKVKSGMSPEDAFAALPTLSDDDAGIWDTASAAQAAGYAYSLAYHLAWLNDEDYAGYTPEQRYEQFMRYLAKAIH